MTIERPMFPPRAEKHCQIISLVDRQKGRRRISIRGGNLRSLEKRFAAMHATTLAGLQMRAMILAEIFGGAEVDEDDTDQLMIHAVVRDLCAMTGQSV